MDDGKWVELEKSQSCQQHCEPRRVVFRAGTSFVRANNHPHLDIVFVEVERVSGTRSRRHHPPHCLHLVAPSEGSCS